MADARRAAWHRFPLGRESPLEFAPRTCPAHLVAHWMVHSRITSASPKRATLESHPRVRGGALNAFTQMLQDEVIQRGTAKCDAVLMMGVRHTVQAPETSRPFEWSSSPSQHCESNLLCCNHLHTSTEFLFQKL